MTRILLIGGSVLLILVLGAAMLWLAGVIAIGAVPPGTRPAPAGLPAPPDTLTVTSEQVPVFYEAVGSVRATTRATLAAQIPGEVLAVAVRAGDTVEEGQLLAELDSREYRARLAQAESGLTAAEAAATRADKTHARMAKLRAQNAATEQQLEAAVAERDRARAQVVMAEEKIVEVEAMLDYTRITAPFAGVVAERLAEPGDLAWPGKALLEVYRPGALRLEAFIREGLINRIAVGDEVTVVLAAVDAEVTGTVGEIVPAADPASRSFLVKIELPASEGLYPGMFGRMRLELDRREAIRIPTAAVHRVGQLATVKVRSGPEAPWQRRFVTLGTLRDGRYEVLSGLADGEVVGVEAGR